MKLCPNPKCKKEVPEFAGHCPHCGTPLTTTKPSGIPFYIVGILFLLIALILLINYIQSRPRKNNRTIKFPPNSSNSILTPTITLIPTIQPTINFSSTPIKSPELSWSKSVVDSSQEPGPFLSLGIGSNENYYLAYFLDRSDNLMVLEGNGTSWKTLSNLQQLNKEGRAVGFYVTLVMKKNNTPYLSYLILDKKIGRAGYPISDGTWSTANVGRNLDVYDMRIALDTTDTPHFAVLTKTGDILYSQQNSGFTKVDTGIFPPDSLMEFPSYFPISLAIDDKNLPHICFTKSDNLLCGTNLGNNWEFTNVAEFGTYPSLQIDGNGNLHVAYYDYKEKVLKYAFLHKDSTSWITETVDSSINVGLFPSLKVDTNNHVHISYFDEGNKSLKYAVGQSGLWQTYTIENESNVGFLSSLVVDHQNNPAIAYIDVDKLSLNILIGRYK